MQIDHITFSKTGGAGIVAETIANAQRELGHDATVLTVVDSDLRSEPLKKPVVTMAAALDQWALSSHSEKTLFSPLRGNLESLDSSKIRPDSIIHLHWMPGVMNHQSVKALLDSGRKVVWTLHDMNPFTGGCHHSRDCEQFTQGCSSCPQAKGPFRGLVKVNLQRRVLERRYPNLRVVSPTKWMFEQAQQSAVFRGQESVVVSNPIGESFFSPTQRPIARKHLGMHEDDFVGVVIAKDLSDTNKNIWQVLNAFEEASKHSNRQLTLLLIGKNGASFSSDHVQIKWVGELEHNQIVGTASAADLFLSGSIAESAGMTVIEGAAMGVPSVALANGGTSSQIENGRTGILTQDFGSFVSGIVDLVDDPKRLSTLGNLARAYAQNYRPDLIATKYIELYDSMS